MSAVKGSASSSRDRDSKRKSVKRAGEKERLTVKKKPAAGVCVFCVFVCCVVCVVLVCSVVLCCVCVEILLYLFVLYLFFVCLLL